MNTRQILLILGFLLLALPGDAEAYLDPGTGSLIVQTVIAGAAAAAYALRQYLMRALWLLRGRGRGKLPPPGEAPPSQS